MFQLGWYLDDAVSQFLARTWDECRLNTSSVDKLAPTKMEGGYRGGGHYHLQSGSLLQRALQQEDEPLQEDCSYSEATTLTTRILALNLTYIATMVVAIETIGQGCKKNGICGIQDTRQST